MVALHSFRAYAYVSCGVGQLVFRYLKFHNILLKLVPVLHEYMNLMRSGVPEPHLWLGSNPWFSVTVCCLPNFSCVTW